jgi:hypothetical protein
MGFDPVCTIFSPQACPKRSRRVYPGGSPNHLAPCIAGGCSAVGSTFSPWLLPSFRVFYLPNRVADLSRQRLDPSMRYAYSGQGEYWTSNGNFLYWKKQSVPRQRHAGTSFGVLYPPRADIIIVRNLWRNERNRMK